MSSMESGEAEVTVTYWAGRGMCEPLRLLLAVKSHPKLYPKASVFETKVHQEHTDHDHYHSCMSCAMIPKPHPCQATGVKFRNVFMTTKDQIEVRKICFDNVEKARF